MLILDTHATVLRTHDLAETIIHRIVQFNQKGSQCIATLKACPQFAPVGGKVVAIMNATAFAGKHRTQRMKELPRLILLGRRWMLWVGFGHDMQNLPKEGTPYGGVRGHLSSGHGGGHARKTGQMVDKSARPTRAIRGDI